MPSLLDRELKRLGHVYLGEDKTQIFKTELCVSRTRGGLPRNIEAVDAERDGSASTQGVHEAETPSNDFPPKDNPLDDDEVVARFFSVLKAPCFFKSRLRQRLCSHCVHESTTKSHSLTITHSQHCTNRRRGGCPEQAH
jgi:hypothetical protein